MNVTHSKVRNRLQVPIVEAILLIRYGLARRLETCVTFQPSADVLKHYHDGPPQSSANEDNDDDTGLAVESDLALWLYRHYRPSTWFMTS